MATREVKMIWKHRELYTIADLVIAVDSLHDEKEARAFKSLYISAERAIGTKDAVGVVEDNLAYITTFLEEHDMERARAWLGI